MAVRLVMNGVQRNCRWTQNATSPSFMHLTMGVSRFGGIGNGLGIVVTLIVDDVELRALAV